MKQLLIGCVFALLVSKAVAVDFVTLDGLSYSNATVSRVEPDGITVKYSKGIVKLAFDNLPADIQTKYGYNSKDADAYRADQDAKRAQGAKVHQAVLSQAAAQQSAQSHKNEQMADTSKLKADAIKGVVCFKLSASCALDNGWICEAYTMKSVLAGGGAGKKNVYENQQDYYATVFVVGLDGLFSGKTWQGNLYPAGTYTPFQNERYRSVYQRFAASPDLAAKVQTEEAK